MRAILINIVFLIIIQSKIMGQIYNYQKDTVSKSFWKSVVIPPKTSAEFFNVNGSGVINKLWLTSFPVTKEEDMALANDLTIKMYWDQSKTAAVCVPVADFFCQPLKLQAIENHFFNATNNQLLFNSTIPMPFRKNAKFIMFNNSDKEIELFYGIDLEFKPVVNNALYLHAYWQESTNLPADKVFNVLPKVNGKGKYLGTHIALKQQNTLKTWPWYTRPITIALDQKPEDESPSLYIKTIDDYFASGWWDREEKHNTFAYQYTGRTLVDLDAEQTLSLVLYKYHVIDPLWFKDSITIKIEKNWNWGNQEIGNANWTTTAFFYLDAPESNISKK